MFTLFILQSAMIGGLAVLSAPAAFHALLGLRGRRFASGADEARLADAVRAQGSDAGVAAGPGVVAGARARRESAKRPPRRARPAQPSPAVNRKEPGRPERALA